MSDASHPEDIALPPAQSPETIREWDRRAIEDLGLPGVVLMENAGAGAARVVRSLHATDPSAYPAPFIVLAGPGNNGGDGYVVARHLDNAGLPVEVWLAFDRSRLAATSDAAIQLNVIERAGLSVHATLPPHRPPTPLESLGRATLIDALLGTGLTRPLGAPYAEWVLAATKSGHPVVAIDVPTGLDAATGAVLGCALRARHTVTFAAPKEGFRRGMGPEICGHVHVVDIGIPRTIWGPAALEAHAPPDPSSRRKAEGESSR